MKRLILIAAALIVSINTYARFGIIAGLTSSATNIKDAASELKGKTISQYHVGITGKIDFGGVFAIQPSLIYSVKGTKLSDFNAKEINFKTGYIELPIQLQLGVPIGKIVRIYGIAEPFAGYAVSNKVEGADLKEKWDNVSNRFEYGIGAGAGVELFEHLQVSVRYFWNLGNIYNLTMQRAVDTVKGKCNGINASLAVLF